MGLGWHGVCSRKRHGRVGVTACVAAYHFARRRALSISAWCHPFDGALTASPTSKTPANSGATLPHPCCTSGRRLKCAFCRFVFGVCQHPRSESLSPDAHTPLPLPLACLGSCTNPFVDAQLMYDKQFYNFCVDYRTCAVGIYYRAACHAEYQTLNRWDELIADEFVICLL